jgi:hypothetical protein
MNGTLGGRGTGDVISKIANYIILVLSAWTIRIELGIVRLASIYRN